METFTELNLLRPTPTSFSTATLPLALASAILSFSLFATVVYYTLKRTQATRFQICIHVVITLIIRLTCFYIRVSCILNYSTGPLCFLSPYAGMDAYLPHPIVFMYTGKDGAWTRVYPAVEGMPVWAGEKLLWDVAKWGVGEVVGLVGYFVGLEVVPFLRVV
ncbi:hypothetical protein HDU98_009161 [Podochytrium sp. JEL0797]|nr:hypothetical protein HDU98_009161 [Podochytrium sp. JEL0797]